MKRWIGLFAHDGSEIWSYPWLAACSVTFRDGVVVETYYTGGY
jgi:hypothetical protein